MSPDEQLPLTMHPGVSPAATASPSQEELWALRFMLSWQELAGEPERRAAARGAVRPALTLSSQELAHSPDGLARQLFYVQQRRRQGALHPAGL